MARARFEPNLAGFAQLRNHPRLVAAMEAAARAAAAGTDLDVVVETWPHQGRRTGPRTSVQIWAGSSAARAAVNRNPAELTAVLARVRL